VILELDDRGWRELSNAVVGMLRRAQTIQERSDARSEARDGGIGARASELAILHFAVDEPVSSSQREPRHERVAGARRGFPDELVAAALDRVSNGVEDVKHRRSLVVGQRGDGRGCQLGERGVGRCDLPACRRGQPHARTASVGAVAPARQVAGALQALDELRGPRLRRAAAAR
jgi:hypothetical protein